MSFNVEYRLLFKIYSPYLVLERNPLKNLSLTLYALSDIILNMHKITADKNSFGKKLLMNIPFILLIALMIAGFGGGLLLLFYSIVSLVAFKSAMIFLIVAGAAAILCGIGLGLILAYKKYYAFYTKKMGWEIVEKNNNTAKIKTSDSSNEKPLIKRLLTIPNIALALLALGSIFAIISAALGCINRDNWVAAIGDYRISKGYYADIKDEPLEYLINDTSNGKQPIDKVIVDLTNNEFRNKQIVVVYTKEKSFTPKIKISGLKKFDSDYKVFPSKDGTITITIGEAPKRDSALDKLLFFVFNDYNIERQIIITIPEDYKDKIKVDYYDIIVDDYEP